MLENFFSFLKKEEQTPNENSVNALKSEHLANGEQPIVACVGTWKDFAENAGETSKAFWTKVDPAEVEDVPFFLRSNVQPKSGQKRGDERESYVISNINEMDKLSRTLRNCTGIAVSGKDKESGKNISFISHESPKYLFSKKRREKFLADFGGRLEEMKERCVKGTVDAAIMEKMKVKKILALIIFRQLNCYLKRHQRSLNLSQ